MGELAESLKGETKSASGLILLGLLGRHGHQPPGKQLPPAPDTARTGGEPPAPSSELQPCCKEKLAKPATRASQHPEHIQKSAPE